MNGMRSLSPTHTRSPMWVMLKIFICNLLWLAEYQCKGVVKFNMSDISFWGQFRPVLVFPINLDLERQDI